MAGLEQALPEVPTQSPAKYDAGMGTIIQGLNTTGTFLIVFIAILINADVIGRSAFNRPIAGVTELASMAIVAIVFLQIPQCLRHHRMTRAEALLNKLAVSSPRIAGTMETLFCLAGAAVFSIIAFAGWRFTVQAWEGNEYEGATGVFMIPVWPIKLAVVIGSALMALQYLHHAWKSGVRAFGRAGSSIQEFTSGSHT